MNSPQNVRAVLVNITNADCSKHEAKNNRYHYYLKFEQSIGFDWLSTQITKVNNEVDPRLEMWEIHPSGLNDFEVELREVARREGIDDGQIGLDEFGRNS